MGGATFHTYHNARGRKVLWESSNEEEEISVGGGPVQGQGLVQNFILLYRDVVLDGAVVHKQAVWVSKTSKVKVYARGCIGGSIFY